MTCRAIPYRITLGSSAQGTSRGVYYVRVAAGGHPSRALRDTAGVQAGALLPVEDCWFPFEPHQAEEQAAPDHSLDMYP